MSNDDISPETLSQICKINQFKGADYNRVKHFAYKYPTAELLATLASFKNKNDLPLFRSNFNSALVAISLFPHPSLLPDLKNNLGKEYANPNFQQAVAAYKDKNQSDPGIDLEKDRRHLPQRNATSGFLHCTASSKNQLPALQRHSCGARKRYLICDFLLNSAFNYGII